MTTYEMDPATKEIAHEIFRAFDGQTEQQREYTAPHLGPIAAHQFFAEINIPFGD